MALPISAPVALMLGARQQGKSERVVQDEIARDLGAAVICAECGATLATYAEQCKAALHIGCDGFLSIEHARARAVRKLRGQ